jgi:CRP-like cAMP-binding protein
MDMLDDFRRTLKAEGTFGPSDELLDRIIDMTEPVALKPGEVLIGYGQFDTNVYIVKEGILQLLYFDGEKEVTFGFAFPGTVLLSPHSFYMGKPALMQVESCRIASAVMKIDKSRFEKLLEESHEFARWMLNLAIGQIYTSELKVTYVSGSAEDRYKSLLKIRPDIITSVSANRLASYLGITPSWMCKLRKKLLYE